MPDGDKAVAVIDTFSLTQRQARAYAGSTLIPEGMRTFENCCAALMMADEMGENRLAVLQNIFIIKGRAGFLTAFMVARANRMGVFKGKLRWRTTQKDAENIVVQCYAKLSAEEEEISIEIDYKTAIESGWTTYHDRDTKQTKTQPRWATPTMIEQMLRWRTASWLIRLYAPEVMMGLPTKEELEDTAEPTTIDMPAPPKLSEFTAQVPKPAEADDTRDETQGRPIGSADDLAGGSSEADAGLAAGGRSRSGARGEEDEQTRASAADAGGSPAPTYEITDSDGTVYDTDLDEVESHLAEVFATARRSGPAAIEAAIENNEGTVGLILMDGHHEIGNRLKIEIAQMRRLLAPPEPEPKGRPKQHRATKAEMAERARVREQLSSTYHDRMEQDAHIAHVQAQQQNPADGPQARSPAAGEASPPNSSQTKGDALPLEGASSLGTRPSYALPPPPLTKDGRPDLRIWADARLIPALRKAATNEELAWIRRDNHSHIEAYKATLSPLGWVNFLAEMDACAKDPGRK